VLRGSPVASRKRFCPPSASSGHFLRNARVCQTIALAIAFPVFFSQMTVVSRWFVIPTAARSAREIPHVRDCFFGDF